MKIEKTEVADKIFALRFQNQYEACSTFMRVAEYYESPYKEIRGRYFTLEQYMDRYARHKGNFTYTTDWGGFNVPGKIFKQFFKVFGHDLLEKEKHLESLFDELTGDFYVIGHYGPTNERVTAETAETILSHEVAHGKFYLDAKYKKECLKLIKGLNPKTVQTITDKLMNLGYTRGVIKDEIQAYLGTSNPEYIQKLFGLRAKGEMKKFRELFLNYIL